MVCIILVSAADDTFMFRDTSNSFAIPCIHGGTSTEEQRKLSFWGMGCVTPSTTDPPPMRVTLVGPELFVVGEGGIVGVGGVSGAEFGGKSGSSSLES